MTLLEEATIEFAALLDQAQLRYMLIGAAAVAAWGEPRATLDIDIAIWVESGQLEATVDLLVSRFAVRTSQPLEIARQDRVLPVRASNGVPVDLLFARWPIEKQALERAAVLQIAGMDVRVAPVDYLVFLKLISERPKDQADATALIRRFRGKIDLEWLEAELSALSESVAQPEMLERFKRMLKGDG